MLTVQFSPLWKVVRAESYFPRGKNIVLKLCSHQSQDMLLVLFVPSTRLNVRTSALAPFNKTSWRDEHDSRFVRPDHD